LEITMKLHQSLLATLLAIAVAAFATPHNAHAQDGRGSTTMRQAAASKPVKSGYIAANGVNYHYQIQGKGKPVLLLHGGLFHTEMFGPTLSLLAESRQVIGVDLQGHGRTALGERMINPVDMGKDMAVIVKQLGHEQVDVMGYSFGGMVALHMAAQHPEHVRRLVLVAAPYAQNGFYPEMLPMQAQVGAAIADAMKNTPMYTSYAAIAPRPQDFPRLLDQMGAFMRTPYEWSDDVKKLAMPVMLVYGDSDMYRPEHVMKFYQLLGGGLKDAGWGRENMSKNRLAILPDVTHYEIGASPRLVPTVLPFLDF
jgi:pimeloyl-ACP methyl ester carboxylesterase